MKSLLLSAWCLAMGVAPSVVRADDEILPRNPFWPQGYEGTRYPITLEPRFKPTPEEMPVVRTNVVTRASLAAAAARAEAERKKLDDPLENPVWTNAVKVLDFSASLSFTSNGQSKAAVMINNRAYAVGDLVSENCGDTRFTWRIESLSSDGKIKLKRITYRKIGTNP